MKSALKRTGSRQKLFLLLLLVFVSAILVLTVVKRSLVNSYLRAFLIKTASLQFNSKVEMKELYISIIPPRVDAKGIKIEKIFGGKSSFSAGDLKVSFSLFPIYLRKIVMPTIELKDSMLKTTAEEIRGFDLEAITGKKKMKGALLSLEIQKIDVEDLKVEIIDHNEYGGRIHFDSIRGMFGRGEGTLTTEGSLDLFKGKRALKIDRILSKISLVRGYVRLDEFVAENGQAKFQLSGQLSPDLDVKGTATSVAGYVLSLLDLGSAVKGDVGAEFAAVGKLGRPRFNGRITSKSMIFSKIAFDDLDIHVKGDPGRIVIDKGILKSSGNLISLKGEMDLEKNYATKFAVEFSGIELKTVLGVFGFEKNMPRTLIDGRIDLGFPDLRKQAFEGGIEGNLKYMGAKYGVGLDRLDPLSFSFTDIPFKGRFEGSGERLLISSFAAEGRGIEASIKGNIGAKGSLEYVIKASSLKGLSLGDMKVEGVLNASGILDWQEKTYKSEGSVGVLDLKVGEGQLGNLTAGYILENGRLNLNRFGISDGEASLSAQGSILFGDKTNVALTASASALRIQKYLSMIFGKDSVGANVSSVIDGSASLSGELKTLSGSMSLTSKDISLYRTSLGSLDIRATLDSGKISLTNLSMFKDGQKVLRGTGLYDPFGKTHMSFSGQGISIDALEFLRLKRFFGESSLAFDVVFERIQENSLSGAFSFYASDIEHKRKDVVTVDFKTDFKKASLSGNYLTDRLTYTVELGFEDGLPYRLIFDSKDLDFVPFISEIMTFNSEKVRGGISMHGELKGEIKRPESLNGRLSIWDLSLMKDDLDIRNAYPSEIVIENGDFSIKGFDLKGTDTQLSLRGRGSLKGENAMSLAGFGSFNLLSVFFKEFTRCEGRVDVEASMEGRWDNINVMGKGRLTNGLMVIRDFPNMIQGISTDITFSHKRLIYENIRGEFGGGRFEGSGTMEIGDFPGGIFFDAQVEVINAQTLFPLEFPSTVSGLLAFKGPYYVPTLSGDLVVQRLKYSEPWDWRSKLISFGRKSYPLTLKNRPSVYLDIRLKADNGSLTVKNNIADAQYSGYLRITGSDLSIGILGAITLVKGKVSFLENEFDLTDANVRFTDDKRFLAVFDVSGKTEVKDTEIFLKLRGTTDRPELLLESVPVKSETDIVTLLTLGIESTDITAGGGGAQQNLSQSVMASILTGGVQENIEKGFRKAKILDTFQIYPSFSEETRTTELRVTLGKEIPYDMKVLYSTDVNNIGKNQEIRVGKDIVKGLSLQGSFKEKQDNRVDLGIDLGFKFDF